MIQKTMVVGPLQCNCTLLYCEESKEAVLIDPGDEASVILKEIESLKLNVKYILHTHAHFDHFAATGEVKSKLVSPILCLHKKDESLYNMLPMQGKMFGFQFTAAPAIEKFLEDEEEIKFGKYEMKVIHTPGHSPGGICFQLKGEAKIFSGDTLFRESVGRSDLWGGNHTLLIQSIKDRLYALEDSTEVFPGHGPATSIWHEKKNNPFT